MHPIIGITMGDAAGIGPEIILKAFASGSLDDLPHVVIGDLSILQAVKDRIGINNLELKAVQRGSDTNTATSRKVLQVLDLQLLQPADVIPGQVDAKVGDAAFRYVLESIKLANEGTVKAVVTAPINKAAIQLAGHHFAGHTEIYASYTDTDHYAMLLHDEKFSVIHVSTHISLQDAITNLRQERIEEVIDLAEDSMLKILGRKPVIAVAGLNPHAGESGLFGREDRDIIAPAVARCAAKGIQVSGPHPPDTVFLHALKGAWDIVVAMYHDQGHIPMKLLSFDSGVNVSVGLPLIRTSVDHGTAYDIAWKGIARYESLIRAIRLAGALTLHSNDKKS